MKMMRKCGLLLLTALLAVSLMACGSKTTEDSADTESASSLQVSTTEAASEDGSTAETQAAQSEAATGESQTVTSTTGFINPLTGEETETDISGNRPVVAMLNTIKQALPQSGNSAADILFEMPEEGGITRVMAVYQDITDVGNIGTIRSTRDYYVKLCMGLDALMVHAGGSDSADELLDQENYDTLNYMSHGSLYWRDSYRKANVGTEHSLYTSSEKLQNYLATASIRTTHQEGFSYPFTFTADGTPTDGESAQEINVSFSSYKQTKFVYDQSTGTYQVYAYGDPYVDEVADVQVSVTNVIVVPTTQTTVDSQGHQDFDLTSGTGYYACGGSYIPIRWEKGDTYDCIRFYNEDGSQLDFGVGKTYICICGSDRPVTFQ